MNQDYLKMLRAAIAGTAGSALGWPMDTAVNAVNLSRAAYGAGAHGLGMIPASSMPEPIDLAGIPGTSAHLREKLGVGDSAGESIAEFLGGMLAPGPKSAKAPKQQIIAGEKSATADRAKLKHATKLEEAGKSREEIFDTTGWFRGPDSKWRYEIDDSASTVWGLAKDDKSMRAEWGPAGFFAKLHGADQGRVMNYPHALQHERLYDAYPSVTGNVRVEDLGPATRGGMDPKDGTIFLNKELPPAQARSTMLHELQHRIQQEEGFTGGTNVRAMEEVFAKRPELGSRYLHPLDMYWHNAGEAEARVVQARKDFTEKQRKKSPPWLSYDERVRPGDLHNVGGMLDDDVALRRLLVKR